MYKKKEEIEWKEAASIIDAAEKTGASRRHISSICNKKRGRKSAKGYVFKWKEQLDLEEEIWEPLKDNPWIDHDFETAEVSNKMRVKSLLGLKSYGYPHGGYICIRINGKSFKMHRLAFAIFKNDELEKKYLSSKTKLSKSEWFSKMDIDHIIELSEGGTNELDNLQVLTKKRTRKKNS